MVNNPFRDGDEIAPGQTVTGDFLLLFPNTTQDQWNKKRSATLTIELRNQEAQTVKLP
jgi:predicted ATP-dependent Lon-type protease